MFQLGGATPLLTPMPCSLVESYGLDSVEIGSGQRLGLTHHVRSYIPNDVVTEANAGESRKAAWTENRNDAACLACTRSVGRRMRFRACLTSGLPAYLA